jgi:K+-transporting ATPase ATPase C chain
LTIKNREAKTMLQHLRASLLLLVLTLLLCCLVYPLVLWAIGQTFFRHQAEGSLIDKSGKPVTSAGQAVGSRLIAQPFTGEEYFQPRPSAASYNAAASGASNWSANNYQLRFRVAKTLGPIVKYGSKDARRGQPVGSDIEKWFQNHPLKEGKGVVAQWAEAWPSAASAWVKDDKVNSAYVEQWEKTHVRDLEQWKKDNPGTPEPKPEDLAVPFFASYSAKHPGRFPSQVEHKTPAGRTEKVMEPVKEGTDIQAYFFDMWRQENPTVELEEVPADLVMASGSGLDPHITLKNAHYQLDRVAAKWAAETKRDPAQVKKEIEDLLRQKSEAPFGRLIGPELVNVLEVNLALNDRYRTQSHATR